MGRTFVFCGTLYLLVLTDVYRGLSAPMRSAWQPLCCGSGTWAVKTWVTGPYCCAAQEQACRLQVGDPRPRPLSAPPMLLLGCGFLFSLLPVSHHLAQAYLFQAASVWVRFVWAACGVRQVGTQETVWPNHASLSWQEPWEPETLVPPSQPPVCWWQCWSRIRACRSSGEPSAPSHHHVPCPHYAWATVIFALSLQTFKRPSEGEGELFYTCLAWVTMPRLPSLVLFPVSQLLNLKDIKVYLRRRVNVVPKNRK